MLKVSDFRGIERVSVREKYPLASLLIRRVERKVFNPSRFPRKLVNENVPVSLPRIVNKPSKLNGLVNVSH